MCPPPPPPSGWKHELVCRIPKKNTELNNLSTLRDIFLIPCLYKLFIKCLLKRITPGLLDDATGFWQRGFVEKQDRWDLIFCLKTAVDDFKHGNSKFYGLLIDFKDAFGSLKQT